MRPFRPALLCALGAALFLGGCGAEPDRPTAPPAADSSTTAPAPPVNPFAEPARRALRIELGLDGYQTVEGTGIDASTFTAHFAGDTLRLIEERMDRGASGGRSTVYYFEGGTLFYAVRDERRLAPGASGAGTLQTRAAFGPDGGIRATQQRIGDAIGPAPAAEVDALREHARTLRDRAFALKRQAAAPEV